MSNPLLSVVMISYGHEKYIKQAIEGVLNQKTNFKFELIIANDASPDKSAEIIHGLISENNNQNCSIVFKNHTKNLGVIPNFLDAINSTKGRYIAFCEGDDYWTYPNKLQKQVDFLESNTTYSFTLHHRERLQNGVLSFQPCNSDSIFLQCIVFRNFELDEFFLKTIHQMVYGDAFLFYKLLSLGKCKIFDFNGAVYRVHENGIHSGLTKINALKINLIALKKIKSYHQTLKNYRIVKLLDLEITKSYVVQLQMFLKNLEVFGFFKLFLQSLKDISILDYLQILKNKISIDA